MTQSWEQQFRPIMDAGSVSGRPVSVRQQQALLGQAVIETIDERGTLIAEASTGTGKSVAYLVPSINKIVSEKKRRLDGNPPRVVVSTETTTLQDQLVDKDLPFLQKVYGDFKFCALKGRSWYLCLNHAKVSRLGKKQLIPLVDKLDSAPRARLGLGERRDVEKFLGYKLDNETWSLISGESTFCADAKCGDGASAERCWSSQARKRALDSDIVVANHALLRTDADMQLMSDGQVTLLGDIKVLIVDEAHTLDKVLIDGWTQEIAPWDVWEAGGDIEAGLNVAAMHTEVGNLGFQVSEAFERVTEVIDSVTRFFKHMALAGGMRDGEWKRQNFALCEYMISGRPSSEYISAMMDYETENVPRIEKALSTLERAAKTLIRAEEIVVDSRGEGLRKIRKGRRLAEELTETLELVKDSLKTRDGIVVKNGVPFGVTCEGITMRKRGDSVILKVTPLDVSGRCERTLWRGKTNILVSATLADPIKPGDMSYVKSSLGIEDARTLMVDSPFAFAEKQLVYVTPAALPTEQVTGAKFSMDELLQLIEASGGRALVLFTAKTELQHAADELRRLQSIGEFDHTLLVQEPGISKQELVEIFKEDETSVLLGSKSFMTGVDFPGDTCSLVVLAKHPLPQYNSHCKQQIAWWRRRNFPQFYEREALLVFSQAVGRLIRSEHDRGVVAILDQRVADPRERVHQNAMIGIAATGSKVTQSIDDVREFLNTVVV